MQQSIQPFSKKAIKRIIKQIPFTKIDKHRYQLMGKFTFDSSFSTSLEDYPISDCFIIFDVFFCPKYKNKVTTLIKLKQDEDVIHIHIGNNDTFEYFLSSVIFSLNYSSNEA